MVFLASWLSSALPLSDPALPRSEKLWCIKFDWFILLLPPLTAGISPTIWIAQNDRPVSRKDVFNIACNTDVVSRAVNLSYCLFLLPLTGKLENVPGCSQGGLFSR